MAELDTRRIRLGPATQQYVDSCMWFVEEAREAQREARLALEVAEELNRATRALPGGAVEERARSALRIEGALGRALARVLAAEVIIQDAAAYLRHLIGVAENSREAARKRRGGSGLEERPPVVPSANGSGAS